MGGSRKWRDLNGNSGKNVPSIRFQPKKQKWSKICETCGLAVETMYPTIFIVGNVKNLKISYRFRRCHWPAPNMWMPSEAEHIVQLGLPIKLQHTTKKSYCIDVYRFIMFNIYFIKFLRCRTTIILRPASHQKKRRRSESQRFCAHHLAESSPANRFLPS